MEGCVDETEADCKRGDPLVPVRKWAVCRHLQGKKGLATRHSLYRL